MSEQNKQFIEALKAYNKEKLSKPIWIPSLEREILFGTLTAKHQKDVIHSTLDNPLLNMIFHEKSYEMIKELCSEPNIVDTFTVFDKDAILIQMRYHFISKDYKGKDFTGVIEAIKSFKENFSPKVETFGDISVQFQIPSLSQERRILKDFSRIKKYKTSAENENQIREIVADVYVLEVIKHVAKININNTYTLDLSIHNFTENTEIVEYLDKMVCDGINEFINGIKRDHQSFYKIDDETEIEIAPDLFN